MDKLCASVSDGLAMNDLCWLDTAHFQALCIALDYMCTLNVQNSHAGQLCFVGDIFIVD